MAVTQDSPHRAEGAGRPYWFCSAACRSTFLADPRKYLAPAGAAAAVAGPVAASAATAGTVYTCPMHPEIRQDHPGNCPKCGMALEPVLPSLDGDENPELLDFQHRFW